jgi:energy-coupling factor transporter transmembrane protein EcfT
MHTLALFLIQNQVDPETAKRLLGFFLAVIPMIILIGLVVVIVPFCFICKKAGFSPWLSLIYIIPLGNLVLNFVLAFGNWNTVPAFQQGWQQQPPYPPQS